MFFGLLDPDQLARGTDQDRDPTIINLQKVISRNTIKKSFLLAS
jgi:hypothetical protein